MAILTTCTLTFIDLNEIHIGDAPANPTNNELWFDTINNILKKYNSKSKIWEVVNDYTQDIIDALEGLQVSSRNLLASTSYESQIVCTNTSNKTGAEFAFVRTIDYVKNIKDKEITVAFDWELVTSTTPSGTFRVQTTGTQVVQIGDITTISNSNYYGTCAFTTTLKAVSGITGIHFRTDLVTGTFKITHPRLFYGSKDLGWTQAPEDLTTQFETIINKQADGVYISVADKDNDIKSLVSFDSKKVVIDSANIDLKGYVTITSLSDPSSSTTIDGNLIETDTLSANKIKTGKIQGKNSNSYFNLDNGTFSLANATQSLMTFNGTSLTFQNNVNYNLDKDDFSSNLGWIKNWTEGSTTINSKQVLSPMAFFGTVNTSKQATGISLGGSLNEIYKTEGIYNNIDDGIAGYKLGTKMFHLKTDGTLMIGPNTTGNYLSWDGSNLNVRASSLNIGSEVVATTGNVNDAVNNIEIGGRNLIRKDTIYGHSVSPTINEYTWSFSTNSNFSGLRISQEILEIGKKYVFSYKFRKVSGDITKIGGHCSHSGEWYIDGVLQNTPYPTGASFGNDINIHEVIVKMNAISTSDMNVYIQPNRGGTASQYSIEIFDLKIEKGNKPTSWTPAIEDIDASISSVSSSLNTLDSSVKSAFGDGIINDSEAKAIASNIQILTNEKSDIDKEYTTIYANTNLLGTAKTNLYNAKVAYDSAHASLISDINTATSDKVITDAERNSVNSFFATYRTKIADYKQRLQEALDYIGTKKVDNIQVGGRNLLKNTDFKKTDTNGNTNKNDNLYAVDWAGYNPGISNPTTNYHAHVDKDTFGFNVIEYNESDGTRHWKGISQDINNIINSIENNYIISFDANATLSGAKIFGGFYYYKIGTTSSSFHSGQFSVSSDLPINEWGRCSANVPLHNDVDLSKKIGFYIYGYGFTSNAIVYIKNVKLEVGNKQSSWTPAPEDIDTAITDVDNKVISTTNRVSTIETDLSSITLRVGTTESTLTTTTTELGKVDGKISDAKSSAVNTAASDATSKANAAQAAAISTSKGYVDGQITTVNKTITAKEAAIKLTTDAIDLRVSSTESSITTVTTDLSKVDGKINNAVDNLQIGGRNLVYKYIKAGSATSKIDDLSVKVGTSFADTYFYLKTTTRIEKGETYILSCDASNVPNGCNWRFGIRTQASSNRLVIDKNGRCYVVCLWDLTIEKDTEFIIDDVDGRPTTAPNIILSNFKLETGNKATDYTPAPEDVDTAITAVETKIESTTNRVSSIETDLNSITSRVSSTESTITSHTTDLGKVDTKISDAKTAAINAAATDATSKANSAKTSAVSTAASDATSKANGALASAKSYTDGQVTTVNETISSKVADIKLTTDSITSRVASTESNISTHTSDIASVLNLTKAMNSGKIIHTDPNFRSGLNNVIRYANSNFTNVTVSRIAKLEDCPSTSTHCVSITHTGTSSPGYGGFYQNISSRANAIFLQKIIAKLPVGYTLNTASNNMGNGYSDKWLTSNKGTGNWEEYIREVRCGSTGSFSSGGHVYVLGSPTPTTTIPLVWYLAYCTAIDITDNDESINTLTTQISTTNSKVSTIESNLSGITSRVSTTESNISTTNGNVTSLTERVRTAEQKITDDSIVATITKSQTDGKNTFIQQSDITQLNDSWSATFKDGYNQGITTINKDGITVTSSGVKSKTSMSANGFKITKTDTNEDVFKVNADGTLTIKGNITVTGGSIPVASLDGKLSSTQLDSTITTDISTAKSSASTALSTANSASSTASTASSNASTALSTANSANTTAGTAKSTADTAKSTATTASTNASSALTAANSAKSTADLLAQGLNKWMLTAYDITGAGYNTATIPTFNMLSNKNVKFIKEVLDSSTSSGMALGDNYIGHAKTNIYLDADYSYTGTLTTDDAGAVYLNGTLVTTTVTCVAKSVTLALKAGWNTVEVLYTEITGGDGFVFVPKFSATTQIKRINAYEVSSVNIVSKLTSETKDVLDTNKTNWGNAYNRVNEWASGAVTGSTTINGGFIETNTISAKHIAIGDFNNYSQLTKGKNLVSGYGTATWVEGTSSNSYWQSSNSYFPFTIDETLNSFKPGDKVQIKFDACTVTSRNVTVGIWFYSDYNSSASTGSITGLVSCTASWGTKNIVLTLPTGDSFPQNAKSIAILILNGTSGELIKVRNVTILRQVAGDLIVDGSITTDHINTNGLNASVIKAGTIDADRIDANTIVSKVNGATTTVSGNKIKTGQITANSGGSYLNLDNGSMMLGTTSLTSYLQWTGSALNIKASSLSISGVSAATTTNVSNAKTEAINEASGVKDTRSTNQSPDWYIANYPQRTIQEFKTLAILGLTGDGTYGTLETKIPWANSSGGYPTQTFFGSNADVFMRRGLSGTTWSEWVRKANATQSDIFNALTNNGTAQGIYLSSGEVYVNASMIKTGTLDASLITTENLTGKTITGGTISGGSININNAFKVDSSGKMTATGADITGKITVSAGSVVPTSTLDGTVSSSQLHSDVNKSITDAATSAANANNKIDGLQIGGRNLFLNSKFDIDTYRWTSAATITTKDGKKCAWINHSSFKSTKTVMQTLLDKIVAGETYTISGWVKTENIISGVTNPTCMFYIDGYYNKSGTSTWYGLGNKSFSSNNDWQFTSMTFVANKTYLPLSTSCNFYIYTRDVTGDIYFHSLKLEIGNKATDWVPALEETVSKVDTMYYLSTSPTSQSGSSWTTTFPTNSVNKFIWTKTVTTYAAGSPSETTPVLYQPDWVQDWDSTKTTITGTSVLAPKIFAGTKETNGTATGVALGSNVFGTGNDYSGLAGYKAGTKTFHFKTDGTLLIGQNTTGNHISWDGSNLSIKASTINLGTQTVATTANVSDAVNLGTLYVKGTGFNRSSNRVVQLNGKDIVNNGAVGSRGFSVTIINRSNLSVRSTTIYDVYGVESMQNNMANALNSLTDDCIVVITSWDAIATNDALDAAIVRCGGTGTRFGGTFHRVPYALVGIPNIGKGAGIEVFTTVDTNAPYAEINTKIINGTPEGINTSSRELYSNLATIKSDLGTITSTVTNDIYTKLQTESAITNKGYQTATQVKQTADALQAKFTQTGGYNVIKNGGFKNGTSGWWSSGHSDNGTDKTWFITEDDSVWVLDGTSALTIKSSNMTTGEWAVNSDTYPVKQNTTYTLSYLTAGHRISSVGHYVRKADWTVLQADSYQPRSGGKDATNWTRVVATFNTGNCSSIFLTFHHLRTDLDAYMWVTDVMVNEGDLPLPWSPNPNEIYDGIVTMDRDGLTVEVIDGGTSKGYSKVSHQGIATYDQWGNTKSFFSDDNAFIRELNVTNINNPYLVQCKPRNTNWYVAQNSTGDGTGRDFNNKANSINSIFEYVKNNYGVYSFQQDLTVYCDDWMYSNENIYIGGWLGSGRISLFFGTNSTFVGSITVEECTCHVHIDGMRTGFSDNNGCMWYRTDGATSGSALSVRAASVSCFSFRLHSNFGNNYGYSFATVTDGSTLSLYANDFVKYWSICRMSNGSSTYIHASRGDIGTTCEAADNSLLVANSWLPLCYSGKEPQNFNNSFGQCVGSDIQNSLWYPKPTPEAPAPVVPPAPTQSWHWAEKTFYFNLSSTTEGTGGSTSNWTDKWGQGKYSTYKAHRGHAVPTESISSWVSGARNISMNLTLTRLSSNHGSHGAVPIPKLLQKDGSYWSCGVAFALGDTKSFALSSGVVAGLSDGSLGELTMWAGTSGTDYSQYNNTSLTVTCEKYY